LIKKALTGVAGAEMLRRYLIVNGITTALLYGAFWAFVPSMPDMLQSARATFDTFSMQSPVLGPFLHRIVMVSGRW
jgi:hypothetical protein